jgi:hypothetical protein
MASASSDTTGALLAHEKIDRYRPLGAFGKPAYQSHVQLRAMLLAKRGPKFANYFAKPTYDADTGELRWTAEVAGEARAWHTMSPEEQVTRALDLEVIRSELASYAQELRAQGGDAQTGGSQAFASLLEQALKVPAQGEFLYFVGEQPVIAFWGFETHAGGSIDAAALAPQFAARARAADIAAPPPQVQTTLGTTAVVTPTRPWWRWLLWALAALLLLLLLLWLLRACTTDVRIGSEEPLTDKPLANRETAGPGIDRPADLPGIRREGGLDGPGGGAQGLGLPDGTAEGSGQAPPETIARGPEGTDPGLPDATANADPKPEGQPPDGKGPTDPLKAPDGKGATDPPLPQDGAPLDLPPDGGKGAKGMGFLAGRWKAGEGLADRNTGQPLDLSFQFDNEGKGEVTVRRPDGSSCKGTVDGAMSGGKLTIQGNQSIPCSGGGSYAAPRIECAKDRAGQTQCFGVNNDGSKYYMGMQRQP